MKNSNEKWKNVILKDINNIDIMDWCIDSKLIDDNADKEYNNN